MFFAQLYFTVNVPIMLTEVPSITVPVKVKSSKVIGIAKATSWTHLERKPINRLAKLVSNDYIMI